MGFRVSPNSNSISGVHNSSRLIRFLELFYTDIVIFWSFGLGALIGRIETAKSFYFYFLRDTSVQSIHHCSSLKRSLSSSSRPFLSHVLLFLMMLDTHLIYCLYFCNSVTRLCGICYHQNRVFLEHVMRKISHWKIGLGVFFCWK